MLTITQLYYLNGVGILLKCGPESLAWMLTTAGSGILLSTVEPKNTMFLGERVFARYFEVHSILRILAACSGLPAPTSSVGIHTGILHSKIVHLSRPISNVAWSSGQIS